MKRMVSLALVLMLIGCLFAFTSCETPDSVIAEADAALLAAPYTITMSMDFDCADPLLSEVFDAMTMELPVTVDGDKLAMDIGMDYMGTKLAVNMTVVDKVLYYNMTIAGQATKMKCTLDDKQLEEFLGDNSAEMPVDVQNFGLLTMEEKDGKWIITCTEITDEGIAAMNELMGESLGDSGSQAQIGDLSYVVTIKDGKYESIALTCSYTVTVADKDYTVSMTMNAAYKYEGVQAIAAPADADKYQNVNYSDILG